MAMGIIEGRSKYNRPFDYNLHCYRDQIKKDTEFLFFPCNLVPPLVIEYENILKCN